MLPGSGYHPSPPVLESRIPHPPGWCVAHGMLAPVPPRGSRAATATCVATSRVGVLTGVLRARPDLKHLLETPSGNGLVTNRAPLRHWGLCSMGAFLRRFYCYVTVITTQLDFATFRVLGSPRSLMAPFSYYVIRSCYQPVIHAAWCCYCCGAAAARLPAPPGPPRLISFFSSIPVQIPTRGRLFPPGPRPP